MAELSNSALEALLRGSSILDCRISSGSDYMVLTINDGKSEYDVQLDFDDATNPANVVANLISPVARLSTTSVATGALGATITTTLGCSAGSFKTSLKVVLYDVTDSTVVATATQVSITDATTASYRFTIPSSINASHTYKLMSKYSNTQDTDGVAFDVTS